jgi:hypothetical protein
VSFPFRCWRAFAFVTDVDSKNPTPMTGLKTLQEHADEYHRAFAASQAHLYSPVADDAE